MTPQQMIDERMKNLSEELRQLENTHQTTVQNYQQTIMNNQNRFQQIKGALAELSLMKANFNGEQP